MTDALGPQFPKTRGPERPNGGDRRPTGSGVGPEPNVAVPSDVLIRYNARVLDPRTAWQLAGQKALRPTVYIGDRLLVDADTTAETRAALDKAAARFGLRVVGDEPAKAMRAPLIAAKAGRPLTIPYRIRLVPIGAEATPAPDAWAVLQTFRSIVGPEAPEQKQVALDHLLSAAGGPSIGGSPFVQGHGIGGSPFVQGHGIGGSPFVQGHGYSSSQYGMPGWGGRQPVNWRGQLPARDESRAARRPVVAVLDTGVGRHDWLPPDIVRLEAVVLDVPVDDPEITGMLGDRYEGDLDTDAGHGTFIAGLIRQQCPDADVLAIRIMGGDGVVAESNLLDALHVLVLRQQMAIEAKDAEALIDVVSLSLGYYHELAEDVAFDPKLLDPIRTLGRMGVAVVTAAGNDSTDRPMYPAAFSPWSGSPDPTTTPGCLPLISVGAWNPNGTVALFSNAGDWVTCHRPGAALVSTYPTTINAAGQPSSALTVGSETRATVDPDDFSCGFAVWSGTSFAGPVLAGELAAFLCESDLTSCEAADAVARGWSALTACVAELAS